jgi:hypothetical protein
MIRSFADKMKGKQEAYQAKQKILAEQAEQARIQNEKLLFLKELEEEKAHLNQKLAEEAHRKEQKYLREKEKQDAITRRRIEEWSAGEDDRLAEIALNKKIIAEAKIRSALREAAMPQKPAPSQQRSAQANMPINASSTWQLTWKSFSTHPDIIDLPMSEKIRLFKRAEQQQPDRTNYYANLFSADNSIGAGRGQYWKDGEVNEADAAYLGQSISADVTWDNSVNVNTPIRVEAGVTLTVIGILTTNAVVTNFGTIRVNGLVIETQPIDNLGSGEVIIE